MKDSLERLLYLDPPLGFPDKTIKVYCEFEVGGAYETWGWVIEHNGKVAGCHKFLDNALDQARVYFRSYLSKTKPKDEGLVEKDRSST